MKYTRQQLNAHLNILERDVFSVDHLPQFRLLLTEIQALASSMPEDAVVVSLERGLLYGGYSLVGPFFHRQQFISIDCSPDSADERGAYNATKVRHADFLPVPITKRTPIESTGLDSNIADLVLVPNLVHHVADQDALFSEMARITKPGGHVFVFEPTMRELHQIPDDYLRYTPFGMQHIMKSKGLRPADTKLEGGPFSAIGYCWLQALEYLPAEEKEKWSQWFFKEHWPQLQDFDAKYTHNLVRKHTRFPTSFSILAEKAGDH